MFVFWVSPTECTLFQDDYEHDDEDNDEDNGEDDDDA